MRRSSLAFCIGMSLVFAGTSASAENDVQATREKLVGVWSGFAVEGKGENPDRGPVQLELTITADTIHGRQLQGTEIIDHGEGTFEIDPKSSPQHLDGTKKTANPNRKEQWAGIYRLDGDTLHWCVGRRERPVDFETKKGAFLLVLKRRP